MTRDDILRLGHETDLFIYNGDNTSLTIWLIPTEEKLLKFANLVAAAEREACAKVCEELPNTFKIAAEEFGYTAEQPTAENYAAAIRTRSDE
jgi:uncharacterized protein YaeQ